MITDSLTRTDNALDGLDREKSPTRSIRRQVLTTVNLPLILVVVVFLGFDYSRDMTERLEEKQIALEEEAKTILPAIEQLHHHNIEATQQYIDAICGVMQAENSPGHHIAVELPIAMLQATSHGRATPEMKVALELAAVSANRRAPYKNTELVVGIARGDNAVVYIAETLAQVKRQVRKGALGRLAGLFVALLLAALLVNMALVQSVTEPIQRLVTTVQRLGSGELDVRSESFCNTELDYLAREIDSMSSALAAVDRARRSHMAKAREIQQHLLPNTVRIPGLCVAHLFQPAEEIGGDYYDILPLKDGAWLICIADVTGHGIPAAMSAAMLKTLLLHAVESYTSPAQLLKIVNQRFIAVSLVGDFVSIILLRVEPQAHRLQYASAGHEPGWLTSPTGDSRELASTGLLLGIDEQATWDEVTIETSVGDRLIALTDGVSETFNSEGEMFGRTRIFGLLSECQELTPEQVVRQIDQALLAFRGNEPQHDDVTAVLLELT